MVVAFKSADVLTGWPAAWDVFDPEVWPEGRAQWHLARCKATSDKLVKYQEIRMASQRLWLHDPEQYRALGYA